MSGRVECSVDTCTEPARARGWCNRHYCAWRKHGDPLTRLVGWAVGPCIVAGCVEPQHARELCAYHYRRQWELGAPGGPRQPKAPLTYSGVHHRLRTAFGDASQHSCVDCNEQASDWSYNHSGVGERIGLVGGVRMPYSLDLTQYQPRCRACHNAYDRARHVDTA